MFHTWTVAPFSDAKLIDSKERGLLELTGPGSSASTGSSARVGAPCFAGSSARTIAAVASFAKFTSSSPVSLSKKADDGTPLGCSPRLSTAPVATSRRCRVTFAWWSCWSSSCPPSAEKQTGASCPGIASRVGSACLVSVSGSHSSGRSNPDAEVVQASSSLLLSPALAIDRAKRLLVSVAIFRYVCSKPVLVSSIAHFIKTKWRARAQKTAGR